MELQELFLNKKMGWPLCLLTLLLGCHSNSQIEASDPNLQQSKGKFYYEGKLFQGVVVEKYDDGVLHSRTPYVAGLSQGKAETWFPNGQQATERFYDRGKKVGEHRGWYASAQPRFYYQFSQGLHHGQFWEWHEKGDIYQYAEFDQGKEVGRQIWRESGKIYANYVMENKTLMGLLGGKLCRQVKGDPLGNTINVE